MMEMEVAYPKVLLVLHLQVILQELVKISRVIMAALLAGGLVELIALLKHAIKILLPQIMLLVVRSLQVV